MDSMKSSMILVWNQLQQICSKNRKILTVLSCIVFTSWGHSQKNEKSGNKDARLKLWTWTRNFLAQESLSFLECFYWRFFRVFFAVREIYLLPRNNVLANFINFFGFSSELVTTRVTYGVCANLEITNLDQRFFTSIF